MKDIFKLLVAEPGVALGFAAILAIFGGFVYFEYKEYQEWEAFKVAHHCEVIREVAARTAWGTDSKGQSVTTTIPGQTTYKCDNGVEYTR